MIVALSGTPGTGKTSVSILLQDLGYEVISLNEIAFKKGFINGFDKKRKSNLLDIKKINNYIKNNFKNDNIVFVEGHLSHWLKCADRVIILRCHPDELRKRLAFKGWSEEKVQENVHAEILDVILIETLDVHSEEHIFEIDTTGKSVVIVASIISEIMNNDFKPMKKYNIGGIDWSEEVFKEFLNKEYRG